MHWRWMPCAVQVHYWETDTANKRQRTVVQTVLVTGCSKRVHSCPSVHMECVAKLACCCRLCCMIVWLYPCSVQEALWQDDAVRFRAGGASGQPAAMHKTLQLAWWQFCCRCVCVLCVCDVTCAPEYHFLLRLDRTRTILLLLRWLGTTPQAYRMPEMRCVHRTE